MSERHIMSILNGGLWHQEVSMHTPPVLRFLHPEPQASNEKRAGYLWLSVLTHFHLPGSFHSPTHSLLYLPIMPLEIRKGPCPYVRIEQYLFEVEWNAIIALSLPVSISLTLLIYLSDPTHSLLCISPTRLDIRHPIREPASSPLAIA